MRSRRKGPLYTTDGVYTARVADIAAVCMCIHISYRRRQHLNSIISALKDTSLGLSPGKLVMIELTVPLGTTRELTREILKAQSVLKAEVDFHLTD